MKNFRHSAPIKASAKGAATIEFALVFLLFFTLFYAIVTYALVFLLQTSFNHAANEGARSAISIDPQAFSSESAYVDNGVIPIVRTTVGRALAWLPTRANNAVLGSGNSNVDVSVSNRIVTVRVIYRNYVGNPLVPILNIPGIGPIFLGPPDLQGVAVLRLA